MRSGSASHSSQTPIDRQTSRRFAKGIGSRRSTGLTPPTLIATRRSGARGVGCILIRLPRGSELGPDSAGSSVSRVAEDCGESAQFRECTSLAGRSKVPAG
jgi:hypothetical protein